MLSELESLAQQITCMSLLLASHSVLVICHTFEAVVLARKVELL